LRSERRTRMKILHKVFSGGLLTIIFSCFFVYLSISLPLAENALIAAQSGVTGAAEGFVKDANTGKIITKAKITLVYTRNEIMKYELHSDKKGHFYKGGLTPGIYRINTEKDGYLPAAQTVRVRLGDTAKVDILLEPMGSAAPVAVSKGKEGLKLFQAGKYGEAAEKFTEGISKGEANTFLYYYRGLSYEKSGQIEKALGDYKKAIELKPDFVLPYSRLGIIYAKEKDYEQAVEFYKKSFELGSKDVTTLYNYGVVLVNIGCSQEAKSVFEKLISLDENYADAYYHLGIIYLGQGDSARAKELLQKFVEMDPENSKAAVAKKILETLN